MIVMRGVGAYCSWDKPEQVPTGVMNLSPERIAEFVAWCRVRIRRRAGLVHHCGIRMTVDFIRLLYRRTLITDSALPRLYHHFVSQLDVKEFPVINYQLQESIHQRRPGLLSV